MPTTITTTTQVSAPGLSNQRKEAVTSTGRLWSAVNNLANTRWEFRYSDNGGSSWTENTSARITYTTSSTGSLFIKDDHAYFVYTSNGAVLLRRMGSIDTATSWGSALSIVGTAGSAPDVIVHTSGSGWMAHVAYRFASTQIIWQAVSITAAGSQSLSGAGQTVSNDVGGGPSIDFAHIGDGVTSTTPHLFFVWQAAAANLGYRKAVYSAGSWSLSITRNLDTWGGSAGPVSSIFDGSRTVAAAIDSAATGTIVIAERDAADTTTTIRNPPALSDGAVTGLSVTSDANQDILLVAVGTTSDDPKYVRYTRATGTWGAWTTIEATTVDLESIVARRAAGYYLDVLYATGASSPYTLRHERVALNSPPNGPPWVTTSGPADVAASLPLDWEFSDPNPVDTQASYVLKRDIGGTIRYYRASDQTWQTTEQTNSTATSSVTLASGWGVNGDPDHQYYVKTTDSLGSTGPYGSALVVTPSAKVNPTLDTPVHLATVTTASMTPAWTVTEQTSYRSVVRDASSAIVYDTGWVADSAARSYTTPAVLRDGATAWTVDIQTKNLEGLASDIDSATFDVDYVAPATPTAELIVTSSLPAILVRIANPSPSGGQPAVTSHDVFVRVAEGRPDGERLVGGDGIRVASGIEAGGSWIDWATASDVDYEYKVVSHGANGAMSESAWIGTGTTLVVTSKLSLPGVSGSTWCADSAALDITGDIDVRWFGTVADLTSGALQIMMGKYGQTTNQRSWFLGVSATGFATMAASSTGIDVPAFTSTDPVTDLVADGEQFGLRMTRVQATGVVTFLVSLDDGITWTQLGATGVTLAGVAIFSGSARLEIGRRDGDGSGNSYLTGTCTRAEVRNAIGGTLVAAPDFRTRTPGASSFSDPQGNTWNVVAPVALVAA